MSTGWDTTFNTSLYTTTFTTSNTLQTSWEFPSQEEIERKRQERLKHDAVIVAAWRRERRKPDGP